MSFFKKTAITVLAFSSIAAATVSADARHVGRNLAIGAIGGFVLGAVIASSRSRYYNDGYYDDRRYYRPRRSAHVSWCYNRYNSYEARSNTWVSYGGRVRNCNSPYGG